ncbi:MAG: hypothetical protein JWN86_1785 [Planctomycetota bacterium]|nr:hypothetical protein [Planctomycetota bacterium]
MLTLILTLAFAQTPKTDPAPVPELVADPNYIPKPGDRLPIHIKHKDEQIPLVLSIFYKDLIDTYLVKDTDGFVEMAKTKKLFPLSHGTNVLVLKYRSTPPYIPEGYPPAVEIRVLDGEYKGKSGYVLAEQLPRMIERKEFVLTPEEEAKIEARIKAKAKAKPKAKRSSR